MSSYRGGQEQARERLVALCLLLQRAFIEKKPLTQDEIIRELTIDEYPVTSKNPKKVKAYDGSDVAVRGKFERDKKAIREHGFDVDTVVLPDGTPGYQIDPSSVYAPPMHFTEDEQRVVRMALRFCGFGRNGAFSVFSDVPATDGGLEYSVNHGPILRAIHLRRRVSFEYQSTAKRERTVEPLTNVQVDGVSYLIARVAGTDEVKGYRYSRMTSIPVVLPETFEVTPELLQVAADWRPQYQKTPTPIDVTVLTNENYAQLLTGQYPNALTATKGKGKVEVGITLDNPHAALRFALEGADRIRVESPKSLIKELSAWLKTVNKGKTPPLDSITFSTTKSSDILGQTLQLLHAVYGSSNGLRVSELAKRFDMAPDDVRLIMGRLVTMEPMPGDYDGIMQFPARVMKECDDWENENTDDSTYFATFDDISDEPPAIMWRDLFELNVALREAQRLYDDPAVGSAIDKIEAVVKGFVHIEHTVDERLLAQINAATQAGEQIKILYTPGYSDEARERTIVPRDVRELNGHSYVRAFCTTRNEWRTFRVDRITDIMAQGPVTADVPADSVTNWLTHIADTGEEVVCLVDANTRYLFEPLPGAQWTTVKDGTHAVKFRVSTPAFLDHLMLRAGAGAVVVTPAYKDAGHELAARIAEAL